MMKQSLEKRLKRRAGRNAKIPDPTGDYSRRTRGQERQESRESSSRNGYI